MLGTWDVNGLLEEMPDEVFAEWAAFAGIEPFGPWADDLRSGKQMAQYANVHRDSKLKREPFIPADFMVSRVKDKKKLGKPSLKVLRIKMEAILGKPDG